MNSNLDVSDKGQLCMNFYMVGLGRQICDKYLLNFMKFFNKFNFYWFTALGFYHMQSAYDRNDYVTIVKENMLTFHKRNFIKYSSSEVSHFNTTYDYDSVLHYSAYAFSRNGRPTIVPVVSDSILKIKTL